MKPSPAIRVANPWDADEKVFAVEHAWDGPEELLYLVRDPKLALPGTKKVYFVQSPWDADKKVYIAQNAWDEHAISGR